MRFEDACVPSWMLQYFRIFWLLILILAANPESTWRFQVPSLNMCGESQRLCCDRKVLPKTSLLTILVSTYSAGSSLAFNEETFCEVRITEYVAMGVTHNTHRPMLAKTQPVRVQQVPKGKPSRADLTAWKNVNICYIPLRRRDLNYGAGNITIKKQPVMDKSLDCDMLWSCRTPKTDQGQHRTTFCNCPMSTKQKKWQQCLHLFKNGRIEKEPSRALDKNQKQQKSQHIKLWNINCQHWLRCLTCSRLRYIQHSMHII